MEGLVDREALHMSLFGYVSEEQEQEQVGLSIPPMEDDQFLSSLMNTNVTDFESFFEKEDVFVEPTPKQTKSGEKLIIRIKKTTRPGKQLKVLKEALLVPKEEKKLVVSPNYGCEKDDFSDAKIEIAKRKLQDGYEKVADAKRQKKIQIIEVQDMKKQLNGRGAGKNSRGKTVKSRIECTFRQLKRLHTAQRPKMTSVF